MKRPSWDEYFMQICHLVGQRSTCLRRQVGALIVRDKHILTTGYNGVPSGLPHCEEVGCIRQKQNIPSGTRHELCRGVHAEQNAIIQAAIHGISIQNATLYCTILPCVLCTKIIINAKIKRIVIADLYPDELSLEMLKEANIKIEVLSSDSS